MNQNTENDLIGMLNQLVVEFKKTNEHLAAIAHQQDETNALLASAIAMFETQTDRICAGLG